MAEWLAGAAETVITAPLGVMLTGFGGRPTGATGLHDELYARALALETEGTRAAIVTADLLGLAFPLVDRIRALAAEQAGIPADRLLLNCSHTHSGPATIRLRGLGEADDAYLDLLVRKIAGVIRMAADRLAPATLRFGTAPVQIGINRREKRPDGTVVLGRNPEGPIDPTVYVLRVDAPTGEPRALLFSHATHPVTLGPANLSYTADYPGYAVSTLRGIEARGGQLPVALFAQGCCGNINCLRVATTFEDARCLGTQLGAAAAIASEKAEPLEGASLRAARETITLPFLPLQSVAEATAALERERARLAQAEATGAGPGLVRLYRGFVEWAEEHLRVAREPESLPNQPFEVQALAVGDTAFVGLPGEVFIELAREIQARSPFPRTVVLAYSNGCIGYVPTAEAHQSGGYEVTNAYQLYGTRMIAPESERLITDAAVRLLQRL